MDSTRRESRRRRESDSREEDEEEAEADDSRREVRRDDSEGGSPTRPCHSDIGPPVLGAGVDVGSEEPRDGRMSRLMSEDSREAG